MVPPLTALFDFLEMPRTMFNSNTGVFGDDRVISRNSFALLADISPVPVLTS
jgi:hypothetical protein